MLCLMKKFSVFQTPSQCRSEINLLHPTLLNPGGTHAVDQFTNTNPADLIDEENSGTNGGENTCNVNPADQFTNISAEAYLHMRTVRASKNCHLHARPHQ